MNLKELLIITRGTKVIIAITFSVSVIAVIIAFIYYRSVNRSEDPRIESARRYLIEFDKSGGTIKGIDSFSYLDSAFAVFKKLPDYHSSFETGIIYNNKCSALLLKAIYDTTITQSEKGTLLSLSLKYNDSSIIVYRNWISEWSPLSETEIRERIMPFIYSDLQALKGHDPNKIIERRIKNIILARTETPRRLSVSLTNRGTLLRHLAKPDSALYFYNEALLLWQENRIARSNLSVLMGGEPVKPTVIESLFPPDKNKD